jgi:glycosyltransferase involved in cell wall biosynthesis
VTATHPQVSFVVLSYNFEAYLPDCLDSILRQAGAHDFEIIVVDDCSTDQSVAVINRYAQADARIKLIAHQQNQGHAVTLNDGIRAARGEFIARIDGDDRYRADFLARVLPIFAQYPEVGLVYGDAAMISQHGKINAERMDSVHHGQDFKGNELIALLEKNFICAPTVISRRQAWQKIIPVPDGLAFHDWYFTVLMAREWEFYYLNQVLADYRIHPRNMHALTPRTGYEEKSVLWLLDKVFAEKETDVALERRKQQARRRIYGAQYLDFANKYFGFKLNAAARRCYWQAITHQPSNLFNAGVWRRLLATMIGRQFYDSAKAWSKLAVSPLAGRRS